MDITIYDILGREIRHLVNRIEEPGYKSIRWNGQNDRGKNMSAGIYICKMEANTYVHTNKMILIK